MSVPGKVNALIQFDVKEIEEIKAGSNVHGYGFREDIFRLKYEAHHEAYPKAISFDLLVTKEAVESGQVSAVIARHLEQEVFGYVLDALWEERKKDGE